jgi:dTDP-4-amino-4,6-dideoxygalactose transaminase
MDPIFVTKTFIPPHQEVFDHMKRAMEKNWLTNRGMLVEELENQISKFLQLEDTKMFCTNNGTIPLQLAIRELGEEGEVITTPFSYVATVSSIIWEHCTPVFVDIHPEYLTIDETKIEDAITEKTTCILATHVFGNPCKVEEINRIANKYNLKVIYDAAHCFGVEYKGKSIFEFGDVSTCSFHSTKIFHTAEGGAVFCKDEKLIKKLFSRHNFGHNGYLEIDELGINGKMSELHAAMGLAVLPYVKSNIEERKQLVEYYKTNLANSKLTFLKIRENTVWNYSYFPVIFESEEKLLSVIAKFEQNQIYARRYFYPSLNKLKFIPKTSHLLSEDIAERILCLPLYFGLSNIDKERILNILKEY